MEYVARGKKFLKLFFPVKLFFTAASMNASVYFLSIILFKPISALNLISRRKAIIFA